MRSMLFLLLLVPVEQVGIPRKTDEYLQKDGRYESKTCKPEIRVKADGQLQAVSGDRIPTCAWSR